MKSIILFCIKNVRKMKMATEINNIKNDDINNSKLRAQIPSQPKTSYFIFTTLLVFLEI